MVKAEIRDVMTDIKAAVRIGQAASVQAALDRLRALPEWASNRALADFTLEQVILPLGQLLAQPRLPGGLLKELVSDPLAGLRAIAAVALAMKFAAGETHSRVDMERLARDPRPEVRQALGRALADSQRVLGPELETMIQKWLQAESPRQRQTALVVLIGLAPAQDARALAWVAHLRHDADAHVQDLLAEFMAKRAQSGQAQVVIERLAAWAKEAAPNARLIARALSANWAAAYVPQVELILLDLERVVGSEREIQRTRAALVRMQKH